MQKEHKQAVMRKAMQRQGMQDCVFKILPQTYKKEGCNHVESIISGGTQGIKTVNQCKANKSCRCFRCSIHISSIKPTSCTTSMCLINVPTVPPTTNGVGVLDACVENTENGCGVAPTAPKAMANQS